MVTHRLVALPGPNAYDFYVAAGNARTHAETIDAIRTRSAASETPKDQQELQRFGIAMPPRIAIPPERPEDEQALQQIEIAIQEEAPALQLLRQGFAYEYNPPPFHVDTSVSDTAAFRSLVRLLSMQSRVRAARGDWSGAADSALDAIRLGVDIPHGGPLVAGLVGISCQALGQRPMWETVDHLDSKQARAAIQRLQTILARHTTYSEVMQEEKRFGQESLKEKFRTLTPRSARAKADSYLSFGDEKNTPLQRYRMILCLLFGQKVIARNYTNYMDQLCASGQKPYGLHLPLPPRPTDPLNQTTVSAFPYARWQFVQAETQNNLLRVALALRAFRLEHGHAPASLSELIPSYLQALPDDPCAIEGTFKYLVQGADDVLYSVGPDGTDDGGTPITNSQYAQYPRSKAYHRVQHDSVGDIVAGINTP